MERVRIEQLAGMQRNPVEGLKAGPDVLLNLYLERAGGYAPFAEKLASPLEELGAGAVARMVGYDPLGDAAFTDSRSGTSIGYSLLTGAGAEDSATAYDPAVPPLAAMVTRFGAYTDRTSYYGRGLEDGSLNVEPLTVGPTIAQDTLDAGGVEVVGTAGTALAFVPETGSLGYVYSCSPSGSLVRVAVDTPDATPEAVATVGGTIGATVVDMAYGNGWLVILGSNGTVAWSNDDFSTSSTASTTGTMRLTWDSRGERFYAGGAGLHRSNVVSTATGPTTWSANLESRGAAQPGAGVANMDGASVVAPLSGDSFVDYSQDGGANWPLFRGVSDAFFAGLGREYLTGGGDGRGVATDGALTVLAVTSTGTVHRRKDSLLVAGSVPSEDLSWTRTAVDVDGAGVALNAIAWNEASSTWFVVSEAGGVFESADGVTWTEAGRASAALDRIVFDAAGNWYATGASQDLNVGVGAVGSPIGFYSIAAIATIPTPSGELVTDIATLQATVPDGLPASLRVTVPETLTATWLDALPASSRQAYLDAVRVYVYVGYDSTAENERPELYLVSVMKLGDEPFLIRQRVVDGLSRDALQAANVVVMRRGVSELHNERVWFTVPESYELPLAQGRPVVPTPTSAGAFGYFLAGDATQAAELLAATSTSGYVDLADGAGAGIVGSVPVSLAADEELSVSVRVTSRGLLTPRAVLRGSYRTATITLTPGATGTFTMEPIDAFGYLPAAEAVVRLNGAGTSLELVSVTAVTPVDAPGYGLTDVGYFFQVTNAIVAEESAITAGGTADVINTDLQLTSEGGPFTVAWTEAGFMNLADPLNYVKVGATTSTSITDLASGPGQNLFVFCQNEVFVIYGDPGLDIGTRIENFGVQRVSGVVGHDVDTPVARLGSGLYCIHRGQLYAVTAEGVSPEPISALVDLNTDAITQVVGDSRHNQLVCLTESGRILRYEVERSSWFEDPWSEDDVELLLPRSPFMGTFGARYVSSAGEVQGITDVTSTTARIDWNDLDLGEKSMVKLWRRVRLHSSDDLEVAPVLTYRARRQFGTSVGRRTEDGAWVFTLGRGVVAAKIDLSFALESLAPGTTIEPPVDIDFVPRYSER